MMPRIHDHDFLVFEEAHDSRPGRICVARHGNECTVKVLRREFDGRLYLKAFNEEHPPVEAKVSQIVAYVVAILQDFDIKDHQRVRRGRAEWDDEGIIA